MEHGPGGRFPQRGVPFLDSTGRGSYAGAIGRMF